MKIFGLAGWSGSGKTTLLEKLLKALTARGLAVSTIKHAHHSVELDRPGKDSYRHREAGATEVMVATSQRWALMHELRGAAEPSVDDLVSRMAPVDLLIIEGFKAHPHPKLEIRRSCIDKPPLWPDDPHIIGIASDHPQPEAPLPVMDIDDTTAIVAFILEKTGLAG